MVAKRKMRAVAAVVMAAAMMAAGCSSTATETQEVPDTFVLAIDGLTNSTDANNYTGTGHRILFDPIKAPLWHYQTFAENGGKVTSPEQLVGYLAEKWTTSPTGIDVTLKEVKSYAGNTLTSEDIKWTFERVFGVNDTVGIGLAKSAGLDEANPVTVIDAKNFRINAKVNYLTVGILDGYQFFPLDSKKVKENSPADDPWGKKYLSTNTATFGPYHVTEFVPTESVTYERNPNFNLFQPAWKRIVMRSIPDAATRVSLLQTGQAHYIGQVGLESLAELRKDNRANVLSTPFGGSDVLELTKTFEPFKDVRVRQAISYAIDREALANGPYRGSAKASTSIVASAVNTQNSTHDAFKFDPAKARALLAEAGQQNLSFTIYANRSTMSGPADNVLTALSQQLKDVGINVSIETVASPQDYRAGYSAGKYQAWMRAEGPLQVDAQYLLNLYHHSKAASNFQAQSDPILDAAIEAAAPLVGPARQAAIAPGIAQFNNLMLNVPLVETSRADVYASSVCPGPRNLSYVIQPQFAKPGACK